MKLTETSAPEYSLTELTREDTRILKTIMGNITGSGLGRAFTDELYSVLNRLPEVRADNTICFNGAFSDKK